MPNVGCMICACNVYDNSIFGTFQQIATRKFFVFFFRKKTLVSDEFCSGTLCVVLWSGIHWKY